jgi:hypothetical protein
MGESKSIVLISNQRIELDHVIRPICQFTSVLEFAVSHFYFLAFLPFYLNRINKKDSQKDAEQKKSGNYFFYDDEENGDDVDDDDI